MTDNSSLAVKGLNLKIPHINIRFSLQRFECTSVMSLFLYLLSCMKRHTTFNFKQIDPLTMRPNLDILLVLHFLEQSIQTMQQQLNCNIKHNSLGFYYFWYKSIQFRTLRRAFVLMTYIQEFNVMFKHHLIVICLSPKVCFNYILHWAKRRLSRSWKDV